MLQGGWPWPGLWSSAEHSPQSVPWDPQIIQQPKAGWAGGPPPGKGWSLPLTSLSTWRPPLPQLLAESPTNCSSPTVGCLWERPTVGSTNGRTGPLPVWGWGCLVWGGNGAQRQSGAKGCAPQLCHCIKLLNFPYLINVLWLQKYTLKYILKIYTLRHYCIKKGAWCMQPTLK